MLKPLGVITFHNPICQDLTHQTYTQIEIHRSEHQSAVAEANQVQNTCSKTQGRWG